MVREPDRRDASRPPRIKTMVAACGADGVFRAADCTGRPDRTSADGPAETSAARFRSGGGWTARLFPVGRAVRRRRSRQACRSRGDGPALLRWDDPDFPLEGCRAVRVSRADASALRCRAAKAGFVVEPDDPRARIVACAGRPRCASAQADTRTDAALIAASGRIPEGVVHVSGCAKGCAHPSPAPSCSSRRREVTTSSGTAGRSIRRSAPG